MSVTRLCFRLTAGTNSIDLARALSLHNRSHKIHQKQVFTVLGGMVVDNTDNKIEVASAPNTWYNKLAVNMVFEDWKNYRHKLLSETGMKGSKYSDFRIQLNQGSNITHPIGFNRQPLLEDEWQYSALTNENNVTKSVILVGDHTPTRYSATKGWIQRTSLPLPTSEPSMADIDGVAGPDYQDDFMVTLTGTNDHVSERVEDVIEENDERPFRLAEIYAGLDDRANLQSQCLTYTSAANPTQMIPGFKALCGLLEVETQAGGPDDGPLLYLDVLNTAEGF